MKIEDRPALKIGDFELIYIDETFDSDAMIRIICDTKSVDVNFHKLRGFLEDLEFDFDL